MPFKKTLYCILVRFQEGVEVDVCIHSTIFKPGELLSYQLELSSDTAPQSPRSDYVSFICAAIAFISFHCHCHFMCLSLLFCEVIHLKAMYYLS